MKIKQHVSWIENHERKSGQIVDVIYSNNGQITGVKISTGTSIIYRAVKRGKILGE